MATVIIQPVGSDDRKEYSYDSAYFYIKPGNVVTFNTDVDIKLKRVSTIETAVGTLDSDLENLGEVVTTKLDGHNYAESVHGHILYINDSGDVSQLPQSTFLPSKDTAAANKVYMGDSEGNMVPTSVIKTAQDVANVDKHLVVNNSGDLTLEEYKLSKLRDVSVDDVAMGDTLYFNGSKWVNINLDERINSLITSSLTLIEADIEGLKTFRTNATAQIQSAQSTADSALSATVTNKGLIDNHKTTLDDHELRIRRLGG